jgi:prolyl-tRNA editing enzyme YbaK/EbsC (Cys-tRNA(Pro) deacylase)
MKPAVEKVVAALRATGLAGEVVEFPVSTRTAGDAAAAIGTSVGQIVKSLVFMAADEPVLVLTSGSNRVDTERLAGELGAPVRKATAEEVRTATGFAIGGVPPLGHTQRLLVVVDRDLLAFDRLYAAAGTPSAVFPITPADLLRVSGGRVADVRAEG